MAQPWSELSDETLTAPAVPVDLSKPLVWWKRLYALASISLAITLLFLPLLRREKPALAALNPISDRPAIASTSLRAETSRWSHSAGLPTPRTRLALVSITPQCRVAFLRALSEFSTGGDNRESAFTRFGVLKDRQRLFRIAGM